MPSNALPLALWLDADRLGWLLPTMDQKKLDLQRDVVKNERREGVDNVPYGRAFETIVAALYPKGHPYSWTTIGSMADLSAASLEDVRTFFRTYYAPNNAALVIAGDFNRDSVRTWVQRYFGDIPRGPEIPARPQPAKVVVPRDTFLVLEDRVQLPQVFNNWTSDRLFGPDDAALDVLAYVLAGDRNARITKRLVYDLQVAQQVGATQSSGRLSGSFHINVIPKPGQSPARMQELVNEELARLAREGIGERELLRAQNTMRARMLDNLASLRGKASRLNFYNHMAGNPDYVQQDAARYDAVTAADVQRVAREYLLKPRVVLTVVPQGKPELAVKKGGIVP
jgi:zinc protease